MDHKIGVSALYIRRRTTNFVFIVLATVAALFGLVWLAFILGALLKAGIEGMSANVFLLSTAPPGMEGGLANAIVGSLEMCGGAVLLGTPIGLFAGTYLAEYGRHWDSSFYIRFVNDILLSAPSIITGLFIYEVIVLRMGHFSGWAGIASLSVIVIPVVVRTTENMLLLVPNGLREAATALGAPTSYVIGKVTWRAAQAGIITGVLLAVARISGETAPLLFTALSNQFWSSSLSGPMASLPVTIFKFAMSPYENWQQLAWAGVFLITVTVLVLNILARVLTREKH